jgi:Ala-tRNA(Pro) deacylase
MEEEDPTTYHNCLAKVAGLTVRLFEHEPVRTSEEASILRGVSMASGAKAMLVTDGTLFVLCVMSAALKLDWKPLKKLLKSNRIKFASEEQVRQITRCLPGAVPPFGSVFGVQTYMDESLVTQGDTINFNCGMRTHSMQMSVHDYIVVEQPIRAQFTKP